MGCSGDVVSVVDDALSSTVVVTAGLGTITLELLEALVVEVITEVVLSSLIDDLISTCGV